MQKDYQIEHEMMRKELWCKIFVMITDRQTLIGENVARIMADAALKDFDDRFPVPVVEDAKPQKPNFPTDRIG